ncbi:transcriptional regulator GlxA family with amidase domain [Pseudomonas sp. OG7]|nr:transcriptional regulator GlxA family with amidase domain [Pseudomonas sp. OG7]
MLAYIDSHLEGDLSVNALSRIANFSAYHFHRQFTAYMGVPVTRYVQLMRLRRAAHQLVASPTTPVLEAAFGAGFESPEAFSRAFKRSAWRRAFLPKRRTGRPGVRCSLCLT